MEYIIGAIIGSVVTSIAIIAMVYFENRRRKSRGKTEE